MTRPSEHTRFDPRTGKELLINPGLLREEVEKRRKIADDLLRTSETLREQAHQIQAEITEEEGELERLERLADMEERYGDGLPERFETDTDFADWLTATETLNDGSYRDELQWGSFNEWRPYDTGQVALFTETPMTEDEALGPVQYYFAGPGGSIGPDGRFGSVHDPDEDGKSQLFLLDLDLTKSRSDDIGFRWDDNPIEDFIETGSPIRKTDRAGAGTKGTRAVEGLGPKNRDETGSSAHRGGWRIAFR